MKQVLVGLILGLTIMSGAAASIVYKNELPLCAVNPLDGCQVLNLKEVEAERKILAEKLAQAGYEGDSIAEQMEGLLTIHQATLTSAQTIVKDMKDELDKPPVPGINAALAQANAIINYSKGRVHALETILCSTPGLADGGHCQL